MNYDLHKLIGVLSAAFLLVIAFTGIYMEFPDWFHGFVGTFAEVSKLDSGVQSVRSDARDPITPDEALAIARARFPNAVFDHLHPPDSANGTYEVAFRQAGEAQRSFGRSQVFLDQYSGNILAVRCPQDFTAADAFFAWQFPLHNGEAFGLFGRWIVFIIGVTPAFLYVTGFLVWWRRRRSCRLQLRRGTERASAVKAQRFEVDSVVWQNQANLPQEAAEVLHRTLVTRDEGRGIRELSRDRSTSESSGKRD